MTTDHAQKILFIGEDSPGSTSAHRAAALGRLGCSVLILNPRTLIAQSTKLRAWLDYRMGQCTRQRELSCAFNKAHSDIVLKPTLVWVEHVEYCGPSVIQWLRNTYKCPIVFFCLDDPTGSRDSNRFASARQALPLYDVCVCLRSQAELELLAHGAKRTLRIFFSYDEIVHFAASQAYSDYGLTFIGTNIPGEQRDAFLLSLMEMGVPLRLYGSRWQRSPHWQKLSSIFAGEFLKDASYTRAIAESALSLGMLSHGNRDLHTTRSLEVPAAGGLLLAERTSEHQLLFEDGVEALFWESPEECALVALDALADPARLHLLRQQAHQRVVDAGFGNEDICRQVLIALRG